MPISATIRPTGRLEILSKQEVERLRDTSKGGLYSILRGCSLAVLNSGNSGDDGKSLLEKHPNFDIEIFQEDRGLKLKLHHAPDAAFVDGYIIKGIQEHLFAVVRDIAYIHNEISSSSDDSEATTNAVFQILRKAHLFKPRLSPNLVVCWGGHSITHKEYSYSKHVGHELGLRSLDICTGCGPGAMKGPMKGATIAHAKQRSRNTRYIGISEPGIIAAEAPNPIVNQLCIMPDIEKRLEAFVRLGHGIIVFPGGVGTAEEILYLLGVLLHPDNKALPFPLVFTGPAGSEGYFEKIDAFIGLALGTEAQARYEIIIDDPVAVARFMHQGMKQVREHRKCSHDAYYYNWSLTIDPIFQRPFVPNHKNMSGLKLQRKQPVHKLAANLRQAFSGIVAGNVKEQGIRAIEERGLFELKGDKEIMAALDQLLKSFVDQQRMKLPGSRYKPCYTLVR